MNIAPASDTVGRGSVPEEIGTFCIAIMSTPRTGNTWLRRLLDVLYSLPQIIADTPEDVVWEELPQQCILQLHWPVDEELEARLLDHDFKIVTLFRHPCDTLISILHFATVWEKTSLWMGGMQGNEAEIVGASPCSREFARYVASDRAKLLLGASAGWAATENCLPVCYETLVQDTAGELQRLTDQLCPAPAEAISAAVEANSLTRLRSSVQNQHFWRGQPGIWKTLLPRSMAQEIEHHHTHTFARMGYTIDADPHLTDADAAANWTALELATMRQEIAESRRQLKQATDELNQSRWKLRDVEVALEKNTASIEPLIEVSPLILSLADRLRRWVWFYRGAVANIKRHLGMHGQRVRKECET